MIVCLCIYTIFIILYTFSISWNSLQHIIIIGAVAFVSSPVFAGSTAASATGRCVGGTMSEDMNDIYEYMNDSKRSTAAATCSKQLPQPSKLIPPRASALPDHSAKMKPKGLPSTATPLTQPVSTRTQHSPHVPKESIMLSE